MTSSIGAGTKKTIDEAHALVIVIKVIKDRQPHLFAFNIIN